MTLDLKLVREACVELWNQYHEQIEELGYSLGKDSLLQGPKEIQIIATIRPKYPDNMFEKFRKIIPREFEYKGETILTIISPSIYEL